MTPQAPVRARRPSAAGADRFHPAPLVTPPAMADATVPAARRPASPARPSPRGRRS